ncbi:MAG: amidohydrolase family protein [Anaerolineae bacterium]|nr:amidohydrolase family protein [Anaerolineae bacterium]
MGFSFKSIPVIDGHIHFGHVDRIDALLQIMKTVPMAKINLASVPVPGTINQNPALIAFKDRYPATTYLSGALDYSQVAAEDWSTVDPAAMSENLGRQIETLKASGFDGLKLLESKPTYRKWIPFPLDAPHYEGMWAALESLAMPVLWHVADPEEFWNDDLAPSFAKEQGWLYGDGTFTTKEALYQEVENVLTRHPQLKVIFAHFYFLSADLELAGRFFDAHPNVCFDLTPGSEMISNFTRNFAAARDFFIRYQDRFVYGTDIMSAGLASAQGTAHALGKAWLVRMYLESAGVFKPQEAMADWLAPDLEGFRGFALPRDVLEKIYHANFERLYGATPAVLNLDRASEVLRRMAAVRGAAGVDGDGTNLARQMEQMLLG